MELRESELIGRVRLLVNEVTKTSRYSMSQIYNLSNEVFGKKETPQSCASCLIRKVKELRDWLDHQDELTRNEEESKNVEPLPSKEEDSINTEEENKPKKKRKEVKDGSTQG